MNETVMPAAELVGFLRAPQITDEAQKIFDVDIDELGYVMNASRLWAYQPASYAGLFDVIKMVNNSAERLSVRQRFILVAACTSAVGDSYCALVYGGRLAGETDEQTAAGVLRGVDDGLTDSERALAAWARKLARDPSGTTAEDVRELREAGFGDAQIFTITVFVALRVAFAAVNDALGLRPDAALGTTVPRAVREAVTFGRPIDEEA